MTYEPPFPPEHVERLQAWHEAAYLEHSAAGERRVSYLGLDLVVPPGVFSPTPMSDLLGQAVLDHVDATDRVLDLGTGCGVNAILAATRSADVTGVDVNPAAVEAAIDNAARNGVAERTTFLVGDLFEPVDGRFDLVVIDPPFRWFAPRDIAERAMTDAGYSTLTRFFAELPERLTGPGKALVFFGTSGDLDYLLRLSDEAGLTRTTVAQRRLERGDMAVDYLTLLLTPASRRPS